jgi:cellular nucleic acid-binding protein
LISGFDSPTFSIGIWWAEFRPRGGKLNVVKLISLNTDKLSTTNIYVLRLEGGRYYVGKSDNVMNRYQQHLNGNGSAWTRKYKPLALEKKIENVSPFQKDMITKEYMSKYGIENVRGGSYVEVELSEFQKEALKMETWAAKDLCTQCGRKGHWAKDCYATKDASGNKIEYKTSSDEDESSSDEDEWGCEYCDRTFTTQYGCIVHERSCKTNKKSYITTQKSGTCYRCGHSGHYSPDCYATRHKKGYDLD